MISLNMHRVRDVQVISVSDGWIGLRIISDQGATPLNLFDMPSPLREKFLAAFGQPLSVDEIIARDIASRAQAHNPQRQGAPVAAG